MMNSIGGPPPPSNFGGGLSQAQPQKLSTEQQEQISDILSDYDADNLSDADASSIVSQIEDLGITPGRALESAFSDAGFDARAVGEQAGVGKGGPGGKGGPAENKVDEALLEVVADALESFDSSDEDVTSFVDLLSSKLEEAGFDTSKPLFDLSV